MPLSYARIGNYYHGDADSTTFASDTFAFGIPTAAGDIPKTGLATYSTSFSASIEDKGDFSLYTADDSTGAATFTADFLDGSVTAGINLNNARSTFGSGVKSFGVLAGTGQIASDGPGFDGTFTNPDVTGEFHGAFFGPQAVEMGMAFDADGSDFSVDGYLAGRHLGAFDSIVENLPTNTPIQSAAGQGAGPGLSFGSGPTVTYLVDSREIKIVTANSSETFGEADLLNSNAYGIAPSAYGYATFVKPGPVPGATSRLQVIRIPIDGVRLTYTLFGSYSAYTSGGSNDSYSFTFGVPTGAADMPRSGSATYATFFGAVIEDKTVPVGSGDFSTGSGRGTATFAADFSSGGVSTSIDLNNALLQPDFVTSKSFGILHGTGAIASNSSAFDGTFSDPGVSGDFHGSFFGPQAVEMGMEFHASSSDFDASGNVVGRKN